MSLNRTTVSSLGEREGWGGGVCWEIKMKHQMTEIR